MRETEIKFRLTDPKRLARRLRAGGFRRETPRTREVNTLFDLPGLPLRRRGELLRIRRYGDEWTLTHKAAGPPGRHKSRIETETDVQDGRRLEAIFRSLGLVPVFRYEKFRSYWTDGRGQVAIDQTPIGNFAEIEGPPRWIDRSARRLGLDRADYMTQTYAELFQQWKRRTGSPAQEMTFKAIRSSGG